MCNNMYAIGLMLRSLGGFEPTLYLDAGHDTQMLPEADDPSLANNYPDWIRKARYFTARTLLQPWSSPLVKELQNQDIVLLSQFGPMLAPYIRARKIFFVTGGDLTDVAFPLKSRPLAANPLVAAGRIVRGFAQRRGIRAVDEIWSQPFRPFSLAESELGVSERVADAYFPIMAPETFFDVGPAPLSPYVESIIRALRSRFERFFFSPSRIYTLEKPGHVRIGLWKHNERFLEAFAVYRERTGDQTTGLVYIDKLGGLDDDETRHFKAKAKALGIEDRLVWLRHPDGLFSRAELKGIYQASHAVVDDFGVGWFGSVVVEGAALGIPVVSYVHEAAMDSLYDAHPLLTTKDADQIASYLERLRNQDFHAAEAERFRRWAGANHSKDGASRIYAAQLERRLGR